MYRITAISFVRGSSRWTMVLPGKNCLSVDYLPVIHEEEEYLKKVIAGPKLKDFTNMVDVAKFRLHHLGGRKEVEFVQSRAPLS